MSPLDLVAKRKESKSLLTCVDSSCIYHHAHGLVPRVIPPANCLVLVPNSS